MTLNHQNPSFTTSVHSIVRRIPHGQTLTYKEVAAKAGRPKAFRAVGNILNKNYDPKIPCHRVVRSDGFVGQYNRGGSTEKIRILKNEGVFLK